MTEWLQYVMAKVLILIVGNSSNSQSLPNGRQKLDHERMIIHNIIVNLYSVICLLASLLKELKILEIIEYEN